MLGTNAETSLAAVRTCASRRGEEQGGYGGLGHAHNKDGLGWCGAGPKGEGGGRTRKRGEASR